MVGNELICSIIHQTKFLVAGGDSVGKLDEANKKVKIILSKEFVKLVRQKETKTCTSTCGFNPWWL